MGTLLSHIVCSLLIFFQEVGEMIVKETQSHASFSPLNQKEQWLTKRELQAHAENSVIFLGRKGLGNIFLPDLATPSCVCGSILEWRSSGGFLLKPTLGWWKPWESQEWQCFCKVSSPEFPSICLSHKAVFQYPTLNKKTKRLVF